MKKNSRRATKFGKRLRGHSLLVDGFDKNSLRLKSEPARNALTAGIASCVFFIFLLLVLMALVLSPSGKYLEGISRLHQAAICTPCLLLIFYITIIQIPEVKKATTLDVKAFFRKNQGELWARVSIGGDARDLARCEIDKIYSPMVGSYGNHIDSRRFFNICFVSENEGEIRFRIYWDAGEFSAFELIQFLDRDLLNSPAWEVRFLLKSDL